MPGIRHGEHLRTLAQRRRAADDAAAAVDAGRVEFVADEKDLPIIGVVAVMLPFTRQVQGIRAGQRLVVQRPYDMAVEPFVEEVTGSERTVAVLPGVPIGQPQLPGRRGGGIPRDALVVVMGVEARIAAEIGVLGDDLRRRLKAGLRRVRRAVGRQGELLVVAHVPDELGLVVAVTRWLLQFDAIGRGTRLDEKMEKTLACGHVRRAVCRDGGFDEQSGADHRQVDGRGQRLVPRITQAKIEYRAGNVRVLRTVGRRAEVECPEHQVAEDRGPDVERVKDVGDGQTVDQVEVVRRPGAPNGRRAGIAAGVDDAGQAERRRHRIAEGARHVDEAARIGRKLARVAIATREDFDFRQCRRVRRHRRLGLRGAGRAGGAGQRRANDDAEQPRGAVGNSQHSMSPERGRTVPPGNHSP